MCKRSSHIQHFKKNLPYKKTQNMQQANLIHARARVRAAMDSKCEDGKRQQARLKRTLRNTLAINPPEEKRHYMEIDMEIGKMTECTPKCQTFQ